jgi:hypothetical protein
MLFDQDKSNYPRSWGEMSFEFKCFFGYHIAMMVLAVVGGMVLLQYKLLIVAAILGGVFVLSVRRRSAMDWHWRPPGIGQILSALFGVALVGVFIASAIPSTPVNGATGTWYLAGFGIGLFAFLRALGITHLAEADFVAECGPIIAAESKSGDIGDPVWKRVVRGAFSIFFLLVWLDGVASFYVFGSAFRAGSPVATATQSVPLVNHGHTVYVEQSRKLLVNRLQAGMMIGIPAAMAFGFVLHFIIGVQLFPNAPTLSQVRSRRATRKLS